MKEVVVISDTHHGHRVGLTPPKYQSAICGDKYYRAQMELWEEAERMRREHLSPDVLIHLGDCIDGKGERSGGSEQLTSDINRQIEMAAEYILSWQAKDILMVYGTPYHTGVQDDAETIIAKEVGAAEISSQIWADIEGVVFDCRHKIAGTSIPHGKGTPISKQWLWNAIWSLTDEQPRASVFLRGHVHNFFHAGDAHWTGFTAPALQGQGTKYGARQCDGHVDFGIMWFECHAGRYTWHHDIVVVDSAKQQPIRL